MNIFYKICFLKKILILINNLFLLFNLIFSKFFLIFYILKFDISLKKKKQKINNFKCTAIWKFAFIIKI